jgi:crossover junction endodeoxyribonuclease RuvC
MAAPAIRVLGIDTSLRSTGVGVVGLEGSRLRPLGYGVLSVPAARPHSECLRRIQEGLREWIAKWAPEGAAVEGGFFHRNAGTAMILGEARGAAIAACAAAGVPVYEYAPRRVKSAVVGFGGASKDQIRAMMKAVLGLAEEPPEDAADALALAVCHLHGRSGHAALMPRPI